MIYCTPPLDASRRELFIRIFKSVVALLVSQQIDFLCILTWAASLISWFELFGLFDLHQFFDPLSNIKHGCK